MWLIWENICFIRERSAKTTCALWHSLFSLTFPFWANISPYLLQADEINFISYVFCTDTDKFISLFRSYGIGHFSLENYISFFKKPIGFKLVMINISASLCKLNHISELHCIKNTYKLLTLKTTFLLLIVTLFAKPMKLKIWMI